MPKDGAKSVSVFSQNYIQAFSQKSRLRSTQRPTFVGEEAVIPGSQGVQAHLQVARKEHEKATTQEGYDAGRRRRGKATTRKGDDAGDCAEGDCAVVDSKVKGGRRLRGRRQ